MMFEEKEKSQSHTFIFFDSGPPYCQLGWSRYRQFNTLILAVLADFERTGTVVYLHEHEFLPIDEAFIWCFTFYQEDPNTRDELSKGLRKRLDSVMAKFVELTEQMAISNHTEDFQLSPDFGMYYVSLVELADMALHPVYPPKEKTYDKPDLDLAVFKDEMTVAKFKELINGHLFSPSLDSMKYFSAPDGFFSTIHRPNKYLREELLPTFYFVRHKQIHDAAALKFGLEKGEVDAKIRLSDQVSMNLEITSALPEGDHLLFSIVNQGWSADLPVKTRHALKKANDSLASKIIAAIARKQEKPYPSNSTLLVVVPPEYVYQGEAYIIKEILEEVRATLVDGKKIFCEIVLVCKQKIYVVF